MTEPSDFAPGSLLAVAPPAIREEHRTLECMVRIYCRRRHRAASRPCGSCAELLRYAELRLARCPFRERKGACRGCRIHCFREPQRTRIRSVMAFAGPWMLLYHPWRTIRHLLR